MQRGTSSAVSHAGVCLECAQVSDDLLATSSTCQVESSPARVSPLTHTHTLYTCIYCMSKKTKQQFYPKLHINFTCNV